MRLSAESVSLSAALPVVPQETWRRWNEDFRHLDQDDDGGTLIGNDEETIKK